jgi:hypothetical protein
MSASAVHRGSEVVAWLWTSGNDGNGWYIANGGVLGQKKTTLALANQVDTC